MDNYKENHEMQETASLLQGVALLQLQMSWTRSSHSLS